MPDHQQLLAAVRDSIRAYCRAGDDGPAPPNQPAVRLHEPTFSSDEIEAAVECLLAAEVTMGARVKRFEREFGEAFGFAHAVMNNSGSSANLLAVAALSNPETEDRLMPGDEVVVPALAWSTTVWPLIQHGLVPVVVDIDPHSLNLDPAAVDRAIGRRTKAIMAVHVYGNPCDMDALLEICGRHGLILIEDCCEATGALYDGTPVGGFGRVGTFSFYYSHHMTTIEGGLCATHDFELAELMRILRAHGWIRDLEDGRRYERRYPDIDPRFLFVNLGYNLRPSELQGAFGSAQLPKLPGFVQRRRETFAVWREALDRWRNFLILQDEAPRGRSSCFGFPLTLTDRASFSTPELRAFLGDAGIETRPVICGNIAMQPGLRLFRHRVSGELPHASRVMRRGIAIGNHQAIDQVARDHVVETLAAFFACHGLA